MLAPRYRRFKLVYDDGRAYGLQFNTLTKSDLAALITAAHKRDKMAVVHISTLQGARDALEAGANGLVHIFNDVAPDAGFARFVAAHHAFVVPTLGVNESAASIPELANTPRMMAGVRTPATMAARRSLPVA